jgi:hypothetical protein
MYGKRVHRETRLNIGGIIYYLRHNYMFRPQYVGHLQVVYEELINKLYKHMWGYIEGLFGKDRDLASERGKSACYIATVSPFCTPPATYVCIAY